MKDESQLKLEMKVLQLEDEINELKNIISIMVSEIDNSFRNQQVDNELDYESGITYPTLINNYFYHAEIDELLNKIK